MKNSKKKSKFLSLILAGVMSLTTPLMVISCSQTSSDSQTPIKDPEITGVDINFSDKKYQPDEYVTFTAQVYPSNITSGLKYEWLLNDEVVGNSTSNSFRYKCKAADNNKQVKVRVTQRVNGKDVIKTSSSKTLRVQEATPIPPSHDPEIESVNISFNSKVYQPNETVTFTAQVYPSNATSGLKYEWLLDNAPIGTTYNATLNYTCKPSDNNKQVKVKVTQTVNGKEIVKYSLPQSLRVEELAPIPPTPPPAETLIQKVNKEIHNITTKQQNLTDAQFKAIDSNNVLNMINIPNISESDRQKLTVINFTSSNPSVSFKVTYGGETSEQITVRWIVAPPPVIENYHLAISKDGTADNITDTSVTYHLLLNSDTTIKQENFLVNVTLNNSQIYPAIVSKTANHNQYTLTINFNSLNPGTKYYITKVSATINNKDYVAYNNTGSEEYNFTTLKTSDSVISITANKTQVIAPDNEINLTVTLDQLLPSNINKQFRISFINRSTNTIITSNPQTLTKGQLIYNFTLSGFSTVGTYNLNKCEIGDGSVWNTLNVNSGVNTSFEYIDNTVERDLPYSTRTLEDYGNCYDLQKAADLSRSEVGVNNYNDDVLSEANLIKNTNYQTYFNTLKARPTIAISNDTINKNLTNNDLFDISSIQVSNDQVSITISNTSGITINNLKVMVKSWDDYHPFAKLIAVNNTGGNTYTFNTNLLNQNQLEYIATDLVINNQYHTQLDLYDGYHINLLNKINLNTSNFEVYRDDTNKHVYGTLAFNWDEATCNLLYGKVFALDFDIKQLPINDPWGGSLLYDQNYAPPLKKRIYVPFEKLSKFSLDGLSSKLTYTLTNIEILNSESYLPFGAKVNVTQKNPFSFNLNWSKQLNLTNQLFEKDSAATRITKKDLKTKQSNSTNQVNIDYSLENMNTLLNYNFDLYNALNRNKDKKVPSNTKFVLTKNGIEQSLRFYMPSEIITDTIFKIAPDYSSASITKNLNNIVGLDSNMYENTIIWLNFELDINARRSADYSEFNDLQSRVRVPVALANLKQFGHIDDVDFMFDNIQGDTNYQQYLFLKIKQNIQFNLSLNENQLTLTLIPRNNDVQFTNNMWDMNTASNRTTYLGNCNTFVNWVQDASISKSILSYQEHNQLDNLTLKGTMTAYNNSYTLDTTSGKSDDPENKDENRKSMTKYRLKPFPSEAEVTKRTFKEDSSVGLQSARSRTFSLDNFGAGTWNCFAKVNNNPNDYRFYAMTNYHVWSTLDKISNGAKPHTDKHGYKYVEFVNPTVITPTLVSSTESDKKQPYYNDLENAPPPEGYKFQLITEPGKGIKVKLFKNFFNKNDGSIEPKYDGFRSNEGFSETKNQTNNLDMVLMEVDLSPFFEQFKGKNLETMDYHGKKLTPKEIGAINHFLNLENVKPIQISTLSRHMSSVSNFNYYISSMPTAGTATNPISVDKRRYREYIIGNNSAKIVRANTLNEVQDALDLERPLMVLQNRYNDIQNGSSGTGVYDSEGKVVGIDYKGHVSSSSFWLIIDTQKYSYLGAKDTKYNPDTFYRRVKKMSYLYPSLYTDIFKNN